MVKEIKGKFFCGRPLCGESFESNTEATGHEECDEFHVAVVDPSKHHGIVPETRFVVFYLGRHTPTTIGKYTKLVDAETAARKLREDIFFGKAQIGLD